jgi:putative endopeptidase
MKLRALSNPCWRRPPQNPGKNRLFQMVGDFYASAMDSAAIEKMGYTPIKNDLARIEILQSLQE